VLLLILDSLLTVMSTFVASEKRFDATICFPRWFQFSCLQKSTGDEQHHDHRGAASHSRDSSRGENDEGTNGKETDVHVVGGSEGSQWYPQKLRTWMRVPSIVCHESLGFWLPK
jgi:hypothetical protein